jgi:hypothetical protein
MLAAALIVPFITVAPNGQHLVLEPGPQNAHSGRRAMHVQLDPATDAELRSAICQRLGLLSPGRLRAEVRHRGQARSVSITFKCFDAEGRIVLQESEDGTAASSSWRTLRVEGTTRTHCYTVELWLEARGPASISFDDAALLDASRKTCSPTPDLRRGGPPGLKAKTVRTQECYG